MADFKAQLGRADHPGLASQADRLNRIVRGQNPYVRHSLPPDSPVFFGRERELAETLAVLRRPDKPGSVSVLGERRFGKSSFLNQVYQSLAAEPGRFFGEFLLAIRRAHAEGGTAPVAPTDHPAAKGGRSRPLAAAVDHPGLCARVYSRTKLRQCKPHQEQPMAVAHIEIPTDVLESARLSVPEVKLELALTLYAQRRLSIGKARELAGMSLWEFRQLLGTRRIPAHYDESDLSDDLATLSELRQAGS